MLQRVSSRPYRGHQHWRAPQAKTVRSHGKNARDVGRADGASRVHLGRVVRRRAQDNRAGHPVRPCAPHQLRHRTAGPHQHLLVRQVHGSPAVPKAHPHAQQGHYLRGQHHQRPHHRAVVRLLLCFFQRRNAWIFHWESHHVAFLQLFPGETIVGYQAGRGVGGWGDGGRVIPREHGVERGCKGCGGRPHVTAPPSARHAIPLRE
mmetsp:Transcript_36425/g.90831  ORF Transcript_36425/g.90831 Transcript_36425/m.90831 type:complete len:205 (+) Transcript_36425:1750-2364(+)